MAPEEIRGESVDGRTDRWAVGAVLYDMAGAAKILAPAGEAKAALDVMAQLLSERPSGLSVHFLRLDPLWDPIRDHPRFKALLAAS